MAGGFAKSTVPGTSVKIVLSIVLGAFAGVVIAWTVLVLARPSTSIDDAIAVIEVAFVLGGAGGGLWWWRRARRGQPSR